MNKNISLALILCAGLTAASCDIILDGDSYFVPQDFSMMITLSDADGGDLLSDSYEGNWRDTSILCTFKGKEYEVKSLDDFNTAGLNLIITSYYDQYTNITSNVLYLGNFGGMTNYDDDIVFSWPDNTADTLHLYNKVTLSETQPSAATEAERYFSYKGEYIMTLPFALVKGNN